MSVFTELDCGSYLRYGSWYSERIKTLESTHPQLYRRFSLAQWTVQDSSGWFCADAPDMKMEQTVQRVSKGPGGHFVVGATLKISAVSEFELLYHEIGSITNVLNIVTSNTSLEHTECHLQHALNPTHRVTVNRSVLKLFDFTNKRQHPDEIDVTVPVPLHNPYTQAAVNREVAERLLNCIEHGEKIFPIDLLLETRSLMPQSK